MGLSTFFRCQQKIFVVCGFSFSILLLSIKETRHKSSPIYETSYLVENQENSKI